MNDKVKKSLVLINVVGLTPSLMGDNTPALNRIVADGFISPLKGVFPAVTCTAQASMLTGKRPDKHGIVANGWYFRHLAEIGFWKQSNALVQGDKLYQRLNKCHDNFNCSKLFWWYNLYADVEQSITPRPHYPADGRKIIDISTTPASLQKIIEERIGPFPFFNFWGPKAGIESSKWIAEAAKIDFEINKPNLQLVYLPHLDYNLQRLGPNHPDINNDVKAIDQVIGGLVDAVKAQGAEVMIVSEYGITAVDTAIPVNRILREHGYVTVRDSLDWELLDPGACRAFAVADHQVAHVYVRDTKDISAVKKLLEARPGIERVLDESGKREFHIAHKRSGELIAIAEKNCWFSYYYWLDDDKAPDFARTVDIHRKPGYDPVELFLDESKSFVKGKIIYRLLQKKLGFRMLMDVIPLNSDLLRGSHGRLTSLAEEGPLIIGPKSMARESYQMTDIFRLVNEYFSEACH